jgi:hypothetical protein
MAICNDISGSNFKLKLTQEDNFGELKRNGYVVVPYSTIGLKYSQNSVESKVMAGGRSPVQQGVGNVEVSGSVEVPLDSKAIGYWLKNLFGKLNTVDNGNGTYSHKFTIEDGCLGSLALAKEASGTAINYLDRGVKVSQFGFNLGDEGEILCSIDLLGKTEQLNHVRTDAIEDYLTADANINSTTISVNDGTKFAEGDVVVINVEKGTVSTDAAKGNSIIELGSGEGSNFSKGDYIELGGHFYIVKAISGDKLYLGTALETEVLSGTKVYVQNNTYKVKAVNANDLTIEPGLKNNVVAGDVIDTSATVLGKIFQNFEATIYSENESAIVDVENISFTYNNNSEGKRTIDSKGSFGKIADGKVSISCEMTLVFSQENADLLEAAKLGKELDIIIKGTNDSGDSFEIKMPTGTLTPDSPEISTPTALSVSMTYSPYKTDTTEAIEFTLTNDKTDY